MSAQEEGELLNRCRVSFGALETEVANRGHCMPVSGARSGERQWLWRRRPGQGQAGAVALYAVASWTGQRVQGRAQRRRASAGMGELALIERTKRSGDRPHASSTRPVASPRHRCCSPAPPDGLPHKLLRRAHAEHVDHRSAGRRCPLSCRTETLPCGSSRSVPATFLLRGRQARAIRRAVATEDGGHLRRLPAGGWDRISACRAFSSPWAGFWW